jgi:hypothetical protein
VEISDQSIVVRCLRKISEREKPSGIKSSLLIVPMILCAQYMQADVYI